LVKGAHVLQAALGESTAKLGGQVLGQPLEQFFAIARPLFAALLEFHNPPADFPVGGRHKRIDGADAVPAGSFEHLADVADKAGIAPRKDKGALLF
jgi:hypothetical protein